MPARNWSILGQKLLSSRLSRSASVSRDSEEVHRSKDAISTSTELNERRSLLAAQ